jgi:hypothetical protein
MHWLRNSLRTVNRLRRDVMKALHTALGMLSATMTPCHWVRTRDYYKDLLEENKSLFNTHLYNEGPKSALKVAEVKAIFPTKMLRLVNGFEVLNHYLMTGYLPPTPKVFAFGEDLGYIGDVNQGFSGLQAKHGEERIFDTGIRELTIMGQGIGLSLAWPAANRRDPIPRLSYFMDCNP